VGQGQLTLNRGHVDYHARTLSEHDRQEGPIHPHRREQVEVKRAPPFVIVERGEATAGADEPDLLQARAQAVRLLGVPVRRLRLLCMRLSSACACRVFHSG
jgi:hypothetical protein